MPFAGVGALLISEPTGNRAFVTEKGALWMRATAHGEYSRNAIVRVARYLEQSACGEKFNRATLLHDAVISAWEDWFVKAGYHPAGLIHSPVYQDFNQLDPDARSARERPAPCQAAPRRHAIRPPGNPEAKTTTPSPSRAKLV